MFSFKTKRKTKKCPLCKSETLLVKTSGSSKSSGSDATLLSAQKVMLGGKRSPTEVCLACCKQLWPTSFMVRVAPRVEDASFFKLAHSLAAIGMDYSTAGLKAHVLKGQAHAHRILTGTNAKFNSFQEICEFTWFLLARSADKNCFLMSGSWQLEDPEFKLFNALSITGYSRVLGAAKLLGAGETTSYGSSHLVGFLQHSRSRGTWNVPEEHVEYKLSNNRTNNGYYQVGIDIPRPTSIKKTDEIGLFAGKRHVLVGKVPPKKFGQKESYTFIKLEWHGTKKPGDALGHIFDFVTTRKSKGKKKENQHKEHADKDQVQKFKDLMAKAFSVHFKSGDTTACLLDTELTLEEVQSRAKVIGLSYMYSLIQQLRQTCDTFLRRGLYSEQVTQVLHDATDLQAEIDSDPTLDHIDIRFGREVIFGVRELLAASHLPNETELKSQMVVYGLANVITAAVCDGNEEADVINISQLTKFFNTVNLKYGRDTSTTVEHAKRTMELIGDGTVAPAAQFKLFLLQRFASYPQQFNDLAEVIAPNKLSPRTTNSTFSSSSPPSTVSSTSSLTSSLTSFQTQPPPRRKPPRSPTKNTTLGTTAKHRVNQTFESNVNEIARHLGKRARGYITFAEVQHFCHLCDDWSSGRSSSRDGGGGGGADPKRSREVAKTILQQIGNGQRTTIEAFQNWMISSYSELYKKNTKQWKSLHRTLMNGLKTNQTKSSSKPTARPIKPTSRPMKPTLRQRHDGSSGIAYWYYLDDQRIEQGPYDQKTMSYWVQEGHFKQSRLVCGVATERSPSSTGSYTTVKHSRLSTFL